MNYKCVAKVLLFLSLILVIGSRSADACSCGGAGNVLESFESASNVVIVKAVSVEKVGKDEELSRVDGVKSTKMVVEKVFKGKLKVNDEMTFAQGGGADCVWTFNEESIGRRFLFYLDKGDKNRAVWFGFGCGRSNTVEGAADDLLYLNRLSKVHSKTRVSGTIEFEGYGSLTNKPEVVGRRIKIIGGGKTYNLKTDKNGVYEIYDLPAGKYQIIPEVSKGWKVNGFYLTLNSDLIRNKDEDGEDEDEDLIKEFTVNLESKKHALLDFHFEIDNHLRGKIYDPNGRLMKGVCVKLFPPTGVATPGFNMYKADCTEENGEFKIDEVPPGSYVIVANDEDEITSRTPFRTLYYPGVFELEKAAVINVGIGDSRDELNIQVPQIEELVTVEGTFLYSDGKPVIDESVGFKAEKKDKYDGDARAKTDSQGRFLIKILKGMRGKLVGSMYTYIGEFENCPKLEAIIRQQNDKSTSYDAKTPEIEINAVENIFDVKLNFPFPGCKKAKN